LGAGGCSIVTAIGRGSISRERVDRSAAHIANAVIALIGDEEATGGVHFDVDWAEERGARG